MYIAKFWLLFFLILNNIRTISQTEISHKFGKIKSNEISQNICPIDSNALAYYLFDEGSSFMLTGGSSWRMAYHRHYRIHILDRSVRKLGIVSSPLYIESPKAKEELIELKASTFNLINSKIVETKLEKNEIKVNKTSEQWSNAHFILPNVKSGSMIEIEYTIYSDFWNTVQPWEFTFGTW